MMIVDAHLDLAYNVLEHGRDLTQPLAAVRAAEKGQSRNGIATVTLPELQKGNVALVFGTIFVMPAASPLASIGTKVGYKDAAEAHRQGMAQLDYYHRLADEHAHIRLVTDAKSLDEVVASFTIEENHLLGIVPLMEGADPIRQPEEAEMWYERGLRLIGLAWDDTRYASGAWRGSKHGLTNDGRQLLDVMAQFGFILDLTHMSEKASLEALDSYPGVVVATHSNARALVPSERQLSDTQIRLIGERQGVIGVVLSSSFLKAGHRRGERKELVTLDHVVAHIDHICQLTGSAAHVGIGSDLDGGFGAADIPNELDSAADLSKIGDKLRERGYEQHDVENILGRNWLTILRRVLP
ncbi:MAG TPA: membrane dipeptidase [Chloroflexota bacterium]|nr:membrane dipeptidase [Chloroflexota bacterium]HUM69316.1 membrane dipeptidase [Chloroflexota bacterium]